MSQQKTLVFLGAHPDDESFGIGSTLAQYAAAGVKVYFVCSTGGEAGTVDPEHMQGYATIQELRSAELKCAAEALGLAGVVYLGFRDSGMTGSENNKHPDSLALAPLEEVAGRIVKTIRELKPDVLITHDAGGGYGHPDHIATHNATVKAFHAAADQAQYPEAGPVFQPRKLYFAVRPRGMTKIIVRLMPLLGQDPRHFGRNKDIDLTGMAALEYPVHAVIRLSKQAIEIRNKAAACHASQGGGRFGGGPFRFIRMIDRLKGPRDYFMRAYPPPTRRRQEKDLFEGVD
ncbi:MAG: PIG-L family deacetylase [Dehalococcoidales bacterium]|nr:PIG-L family deacetylase [Dehalococcoidales bacterium]